MLFMIIAAGLAYALHPTHKIADEGEKVNLEAMIPKQFGDWKLDETMHPQKVSAEVESNLEMIYNQTLSRTYINKQGEQIMQSNASGCPPRCEN